MLQPGRNASSDEYRYGFNGMEMDNEMHATTGTSYDFGARMYDSRVGRFLSLDRFASDFSSTSPYCFAGNSPVFAVDNNGDSIYVVIGGTIYNQSSAAGQTESKPRALSGSHEQTCIRPKPALAEAPRRTQAGHP